MLRYAIVDDTCTSAHLTRLAANGIDYVQLRAKHLPAGQLATLARTLLDALTGTPTRLLINTRADVALATRAHGVHLTSSPGELTPHQIRTLYRNAPNPLIPVPCTSLSCHTLADVHRAVTLAPDLILFGPIFEKRVPATRDQAEFLQPGIGLHALEAAVRAAHGIPVLALGGITQQNTSACLQAGAAGIAAIRLFA